MEMKPWNGIGNGYNLVDLMFFDVCDLGYIQDSKQLA